MTEIYFIRSCEPEPLSGDDYHRKLTAKGSSDVALVTKYLTSERINAVVSSPYVRAVDTVFPYANASGLRLEKSFDLSEARLDRYITSNPVELARKRWEDFDYRASDGESLGEVQRRCVAVTHDILDRYPMRRVAVSSHHTSICTVINYFCPDFGVEQYLELENMEPYIVHMSFFGDRCERLEIIDPLAPSLPHPTGRRSDDELKMVNAKDIPAADIRSYIQEFRLMGEHPYGLYHLSMFDTVEQWQEHLHTAAAEVWFGQRVRDGVLVGVYSLRHTLDDFEQKYIGHIGYSVRLSERWKGYASELLYQGIQQAHAAGIDHPLVTCDNRNIGSKKVIEGGGGILKSISVSDLNRSPSGLVLLFSV